MKVHVTPIVHVQTDDARVEFLRNRSFEVEVKADYPWNRAFTEGRKSFAITTLHELEVLLAICQNPQDSDNAEDVAWLKDTFSNLVRFKGALDGR